MTRKPEPLSDKEKDLLRGASFLTALAMHANVSRIEEHLATARQIAHVMTTHDPSFEALVKAIDEASARVPDQTLRLAEALGVNVADIEHVNPGRYARLRARFNGDDWEIYDEDPYKPEHPADVLKRLGGLR